MQFEKELEAVLKEIISRWDLPGLAVGIVQGDEIVYAAGFGVQSLDSCTPVTLESIFCVASVSKCFVATAVMQMVESGKIDLAASPGRYLPYFRMDDERCRQITIRQMLSHTSGMPDMDEQEYDEMVRRPEWDEGAAERYVRSLAGRKLIADPGGRFQYSNIAYNVLGDVLAKVSGRSFESAVREGLLRPTGMPDSTFLLAEVPSNLLARPHLRSPELRLNPIYPYHRADAPASFLHATLVDMCHWAITCLHRGRVHETSLLSPAAFEQMWTPVADWGFSRPSMYEQMGLGWTLGHYKNESTISHGGMGFGWSDFLLLLPEKNSAAVVLCNGESFARTRIVHALADALLGLKPQANTVSWMVPISRALAEGGLQAAFARYRELKAEGQHEFYFEPEDLLGLSQQLLSAGKPDLAIGVLGLNIHAFPEYPASYLEQAKLYLRKGEPAPAEDALIKILSIQPDNAAAIRLLDQIHPQGHV